MEEWDPVSSYRVLGPVDASDHGRTSIRDHDCRCRTLRDYRRYSVDQIGEVGCIVLEFERHDNRAFGRYLRGCSQFKSSVHISCGDSEVGDGLDRYLSSLYNVSLLVILGCNRWA